MANLEQAVVRRQVESIQFGIYTDEEVRTRSVTELISPEAFDNLSTPLPRGLYDPHLGPTDSKQVCITCGNHYQHCPGHSGHIELCVPVYQPLVFSKMVNMLKMKCWNCHCFKLSKGRCEEFACMFYLLSVGRLKECLELEEEIGVIKKVAWNKQYKSSSSTSATTSYADVQELLSEKLSLRPPSSSTNNKFVFTSAEREAHRLLLKRFASENNACKKCQNCSAFSPKIRQDQFNKIFQSPLGVAGKKHNDAMRIKLRAAVSLEKRLNNNKKKKNKNGGDDDDGGGGGGGWESDDSDVQDSSDEEQEIAPPPPPTTNSDSEKEEEEEEEEEDDLLRVNRNAKVLSTSTKPLSKKEGREEKEKNKASDKFIHALEVEAQIRLTWNYCETLCCYLFGNAHTSLTSSSSSSGKETLSKGYTFFFMRAIPVPPSRFRPPMVLGTMTVEHAQNFYLNKILTLNDDLRTTFALITKLGNEIAALEKNDDDDDDEEEDEDDDDDESGSDSDSDSNNKKKKKKKKKDVPSLKLNKDKIQARSISLWIDLQTTVNCYVDSSRDPSAAAASGDVPNGIRQLLEKKEGMFRKHMMGKRVNYACRSVISPDPYIGTNEIGIPLHFAKTLTYPTPVTSRNISEMRKLVKRGPNEYPGAVWVEFSGGGRRVELSRMDQTKREALAARLLSGGGKKEGVVRVGRQLRNGDMMLVNRQPTLHKPGIMAHYVRILHSPTQKTIRMHYANCNTYNADFDGDEMNCHFPQNDLASAESKFIAAADLQFIVPTDGSPLRGLIQDHVDSGVKLCGKDTFLEKWEFQQLLFAALASLPGLEVIGSDMDIEMVPPAIRKPKELWTGKQVISALLQHLRRGNDRDVGSKEKILPGVCMERKAKTPGWAFGEENEEHLVLIRDGELLRGVLDKATFGSSDFSLVHAVYEAYGPSKAGLLLNSLGRVFTAYLQFYSGHSCRMEDLVLTADADRERKKLVQLAYNMGSRAAKAWADSDGGKIEIKPVKDQPGAEKPLKPVEKAAAAAKIGELLSGKEGAANFAALDGYMQSQLNPLASQIIKACLPNGLAVLFPTNTFGLMVTTGAKGSTVNQSQVSCALGQQALEGRRVPRMSSGRTLPSFAPYDPNPRADGFIADRFLTGVRPQEYYFHCMAGREGLVDTAVKTSRSGYLQRCLVKHLEELKVCYDGTVRDGEGGVVQFIYGEDGIDPTKAAHLDGSSRTLEYIARNHKSLEQKYRALPNSTIDIAAKDSARAETIKNGSTDLLQKGDFVKARKLRVGREWIRGALCRGWFDAIITKRYKDGFHFDLLYLPDKVPASHVPTEVTLANCGGRYTPAMSSTCIVIKPGVPDPITCDSSRENGAHRIGSSGACVSEKVASTTMAALKSDSKLSTAMKSAGISTKDFKRLVAAKYSSALCDPGEAVGSIAAQSVGEPSTQMTLNTFHLAGSGANVTLGIPRLREIIMTASRDLKTPTMSVPLRSSVTDRAATRLMRQFLKIDLLELIASHGGITVKESLQQNESGEWERAYYVSLKLHPAERMREAFGMNLDDVARAITSTFIPALARTMNQELKKSVSSDDPTVMKVAGGESSEYIASEKSAISKAKKRAKEDDEYEDEKAGDEDGVTANFGHRKEMASYGDMDDEEKAIAKASNKDDSENLFDYYSDDEDEPVTVTDDEDEEEGDDGNFGGNAVRIDKRKNVIHLRPLTVDPAARPLLMVGLVERAAASTIVRCRKKIDEAFVNEEEGRGRCLQTAGCNFEEIWKLSADLVDHNSLASNDIWAMRLAYGVEAARMNIGEQIRSVFAVYGISVDPRHLSLIADYMTFGGGFKAMNRLGMADIGSAFLQMSFETTANFMVEAALNNRTEPMMSPSANIVLGCPVKHGTGAFDCFVSA